MTSHILLPQRCALTSQVFTRARNRWKAMMMSLVSRMLEDASVGCLPLKETCGHRSHKHRHVERAFGGEWSVSFPPPPNRRSSPEV